MGDFGVAGLWYHRSVLISLNETVKRYAAMTEFKQQASRALVEKRSTPIMRNTKVDGDCVPAESPKFETMDDGRVQELSRLIVDQRSKTLEYLAKR